MCLHTQYKQTHTAGTHTQQAHTQQAHTHTAGTLTLTHTRLCIIFFCCLSFCLWAVFLSTRSKYLFFSLSVCVWFSGASLSPSVSVCLCVCMCVCRVFALEPGAACLLKLTRKFSLRFTLKFYVIKLLSLWLFLLDDAANANAEKWCDFGRALWPRPNVMGGDRRGEQQME